MYNNPYFPQMPQQASILPHQQIIQVNGKASVDTIQLAPNSSVLVMDTSAPIVWMCVSDGIGKVTSTPYDIVMHKEDPPADMKSIEERLANLERAFQKMEVKSNGKSDASRIKSKQGLADDSAD